ncbi:MAG TPA: hypothetical protein VK941_01780 [Gillisia sp.]|nr:hypothetical protein [Gillisia sp.]
MKKIITAAFLLFSISSFSQQVIAEEEDIPKRDILKNELSIGAFNLVVLGALDLAYERIITPNSSWAVEAFVLALDREEEYASDFYGKDFSLTGKYKYFFGERTAWGFYVNGLAMISAGEYDQRVMRSEGWYDYEPENYADFALGFGLGGKFVSKQGFFLDLSTGIGRNLFNNNSPTIVGQFNVNLGFRF